jgi:hypothetical protein
MNQASRAFQQEKTSQPSQIQSGGIPEASKEKKE